MISVVCTLFEGEYHHGVAAMVNSLCHNGFEGAIFAGYRGTLPDWAQKLTGAHDSAAAISKNVSLSFVRLDPAAHFTNYKPDFMLGLWSMLPPETNHLVYADPDLLFDAPWRYFDEVLDCGILLCEDVNSPLNAHHPTRAAWKQYFPDLPGNVSWDLLVNGGFIGVPRGASHFLTQWRDLNARVATILGGPEITGLDGKKLPLTPFADCFSQPDQDALNALIAASPGESFCVLGRQAMGFSPGRSILPHAQGYFALKPWCKNYLREALRGNPPSVADRAFWHYAGTGPLRTFEENVINRARTILSAAALAGRFYRRS